MVKTPIVRTFGDVKKERVERRFMNRRFLTDQVGEPTCAPNHFPLPKDCSHSKDRYGRSSSHGKVGIVAGPVPKGLFWFFNFLKRLKVQSFMDDVFRKEKIF